MEVRTSMQLASLNREITTVRRSGRVEASVACLHKLWLERVFPAALTLRNEVKPYEPG
jgi:hypothetical protein